jgi:hypothetical protein
VYPLTSIHRLSTRHAMELALAWLVAGQKTLGGASLWYRIDCGTVQNVLFGAVYSHVPARQTARQIFSYKWGAAGWGGIAYVNV